MKPTMDCLLSSILALAVVCALGAALFSVASYFDASEEWDPVPTEPHADSAGGLRAAVTEADRAIVQMRDVKGRRVTMQDVRESADQFARAQALPGVALAALERCDETLLPQHPRGYWLISAALVREAARRGAFAAPGVK